MNADFRRMEREVETLEHDLKRKRSELATARTRCEHQWGETRYDPIVTGGYTEPGDPPGTMGVDRRGPFHVPRKEEPRWRRTCTICGLTEETRKVREEVKRHPDFR